MIKQISKRVGSTKGKSALKIAMPDTSNLHIQVNSNDTGDDCRIKTDSSKDGSSSTPTISLIAQQLGKGNEEILSPKLFMNEQINILPYKRHLEICKTDFKVGRILGKGSFGVIHEGEVNNLRYTGSKTTVAIKSINGQATLDMATFFLGEIKIMSNLELHCNLVNMLGSCTSNLKVDGNAWLIMEYCNEKDLLQFLIKNRNQFKKVFKADKREAHNDTTEMIHVRSILTIAFDIAKGMEYLASKRIMHGDLAARNILLSSNNACKNRLHAKIADFGLSKVMANKSYYRKQTRNYVPWKWMAFEFLDDGIFKMKSDVWSFGVVIWELFSLGNEPYNQEEYQDVLEKLNNGYYLQCPEEVDRIRSWSAKEIYNNLAKMCFVKKEFDRSSFSDIIRYLALKLSNNELIQYESLRSSYLNHEC